MAVDGACGHRHRLPGAAAADAGDRAALLGRIDPARAVNDPAGVGGDTVATIRLAEIPLILPARPHGLRVLVDNALEQLGVSARVEFEVDAMPSTLSLVEQGVGYTVLSEAAVKHLLKAGRIRSWSLMAAVSESDAEHQSRDERP